MQTAATAPSRINPAFKAGRNGRKAEKWERERGRCEARPNQDDEAAFFGSFCLMCGEPCSGQSAYCSDTCQHLDASDAALHTSAYSPALSATSVPALIASRPQGQRRSGPSSAHSSSPPSSIANSPSSISMASGRIAILAGGPLGAGDEPDDLDLGEGVLSGEALRGLSHRGTATGGVGSGDTLKHIDSVLYSSPVKSSAPAAVARREREATVRSPPPSVVRTAGSDHAHGHVHASHLPLLFAHWQAAHDSHHGESIFSLVSGGDASLPPSPAVKAQLAQPALTSAAAAAALRCESPHPRNDPSVLLASTAQRSSQAQSAAKVDARASLAKALGAVLPSSTVLSRGAHIEEPTRSATAKELEQRLLQAQKERRRASAPLMRGGASGSHPHGNGVLAVWQEKLKGFVKGTSVAHPGSKGRRSEDEDEMTGVALGLRQSRSSIDSSSISLCSNPLFSSSSRPQLHRYTSQITGARPGRYIFGKGRQTSSSSSEEVPFVPSRPLPTVPADSSAASRSLPRSRSQGRSPRAPRAPRVAPMAGIAVAGVALQGRGRSGFRGTAAVRSRSPDRSLSSPRARAPSAGGLVSHPPVLGESDDEGQVAEDEAEEETRGRGRRRNRSRSVSKKVVAGYGYYS